MEQQYVAFRIRWCDKSMMAVLLWLNHNYPDTSVWRLTHDDYHRPMIVFDDGEFASLFLMVNSDHIVDYYRF